jgi:hypothetical protein
MMGNELSSQQRFEIAEDVLYQSVDDEVVLLNLRNQKYYGLDCIGTRMWQLLLEYRSVATVVDCICDEYDADRIVVLRDVESMVQDFCAAGLVRAVDPGQTATHFPPSNIP